MKYKLFLNSNLQPVSPDRATLVKVMDDEGKVTFYKPKPANTQKADYRRILPNPMHTATPDEIERCKSALASLPEATLKGAKTEDVLLDDLISIQPTIDNEKVEGMVEAGMAKLKDAPSGLGLRYGDKVYLVDGNHRAIALGRLGETEMSLRVADVE